MSTMQTPPPDAPVPAGPPERRCPRCGSVLSPDQEWCLACGAAAGTEVVESRGWRVPIYMGGGLVALAILGVLLAIAALTNRNDKVAGTPTPGPSAVGTPATPAPTTSALPTLTPTPSTDPSLSPTATVSPTVTTTPAPTETATTDGTFEGWTGSDGDYTVIIESANSRSAAEKVAQEAQDKGITVGILNSSDYSSLNAGYQVVFSGAYASKSEAEDALDSVKSDYSDAYIRQIKT